MQFSSAIFNTLIKAPQACDNTDKAKKSEQAVRVVLHRQVHNPQQHPIKRYSA